MFNVSHKPKDGENAGLEVFLSKEQTLEVLAMREVRNSIEAYSGRGKDSWNG